MMLLETLGPNSTPKTNQVLEQVSGVQENSRGECEGQETCLIPLVWRQQGLQQHGLVVRESLWKNPFMHGAFGATPLESPRSVFH